MLTYRRHHPVWLDTLDGEPEELERVPAAAWASLGAGANEKHLEDLIAKRPGVLPISEFGNVFRQLTCIGRQVPTAAGPVDLLFMSKHGRLVLVETKLHKNPEARRQVIAQVLDYAAHLHEFSIERITSVAEEHWKANQTVPFPGLAAMIRGLGGPGGSPLEGEDFADDDAQFLADVQRALRAGEMLGLMVLDHVNPKTDSLVELWNRGQSMAIELGLVEMAIYRRKGTTGPLLVFPHVSQKALPLQRVVVEVRSAGTNELIPVSAVSRQEEDSSRIAAGKKPKLAGRAAFLEAVDQPVRGRVERVVSLIDELEAQAGDVLEVHEKPTQWGLYWQSEQKPVRLLSIDKAGDLHVVPKYLESAANKVLSDRYRELMAPLLLYAMKGSDQWWRIPLTAENIEVVLAESRRAITSLTSELAEFEQPSVG